MGLIQYYQITCQHVNQAICIFIIMPIVFCNLVSRKCIIVLFIPQFSPHHQSAILFTILMPFFTTLSDTCHMYHHLFFNSSSLFGNCHTNFFTPPFTPLSSQPTNMSHATCSLLYTPSVPELIPLVLHTLDIATSQHKFSTQVLLVCPFFHTLVFNCICHLIRFILCLKKLVYNWISICVSHV